MLVMRRDEMKIWNKLFNENLKLTFYDKMRVQQISFVLMLFHLFLFITVSTKILKSTNLA
jgi:hypothetical protein